MAISLRHPAAEAPELSVKQRLKHALHPAADWLALAWY